MKYVIDLPSTYISKSTLFGDTLIIPMCLEGSRHYGIPTGIKLEPYKEIDQVKYLDLEEYKRTIEDEVWGFTKTFINMCVEDFHNAFNTISYKHLTDFSYQKAKSKYNEWIKRNHDGCNGCKHEDKMNYEEPCYSCKQNYKDKWEGEF